LRKQRREKHPAIFVKPPAGTGNARGLLLLVEQLKWFFSLDFISVNAPLSAPLPVLRIKITV
jgi:hypothetical protein